MDDGPIRGGTRRSNERNKLIEAAALLPNAVVDSHFTFPNDEVVQFLNAVLPRVYHHPPPGRVERSEGRAEHWIQRVTLPGLKGA
ncbi:MAG: hypothetical protein Rhob2KO_12140 [Rhodopirellula baltica]